MSSGCTTAYVLIHVEYVLLWFQRQVSCTADDLKAFVSAKCNEVIVFSMNGCPYCVEAVKSLTAAGKSPVEVKVTGAGSAKPSALASVLEATTKQDSYPYVFLKGRFVGGCNDGPEDWMGVKSIIKRGELAKYLQ